MNDLIKREDAIKTARLMIGLTANEREDEIRRIPTADNSISLLPNDELLIDTEYTDKVKSVRLMNFEGFTRVFDEPKVGRWIKLDETETLNESYTCSQCGYRKWVSKVRFLYEPKLVLNYCPNCGAKMKGE